LLKRSCGKELEIKTSANANDYQHRITVKAHIQVREMNDFVESVEFRKFHTIKLERIQKKIQHKCYYIIVIIIM
jgi:hypothetical protein